MVNNDIQPDAVYDPWAVTPSAPSLDDKKFDFIPKPKATVIPVTTKQAPISLAANGKPIPSVKNPDGGISYNPSFEEWDKLLIEEGTKEVEAEKQRIEEEKAEQERQARIAAAKDEDDEAQSNDESAWEGFESEYETADWLKKKRPERKTKAQRNKIKRRKEAERKAKWEAKMKKREEQASQIKAIVKAMREKGEAEELQAKEDGSSEEGDDRILRKRPFGGKHHVPEKPLELVLPDELKDSLRLLRPEGNLLGDRFRSLQVQGKLEVRKPVSQPKKARRTGHGAVTNDTKMDLKDLSSNWKKLQSTLKEGKPSTGVKRSASDAVHQNGVKRRKHAASSRPVHTNKTTEKRERVFKKRKMSSVITGVTDGVEKLTVNGDAESKESAAQLKKRDIGRERVNEGLSPTAEVGKYIAIDCEMVGVGPNPDRDSALARVSIVNFTGDQVYDSFVKPKETVTDWRTKVSGITPMSMIDARSFEEVQKDVAELLDGRILIGHAVSNDLNALLLSHPKRDIRDTSSHIPYRKIAGGAKPRLKVLAAELLGVTIQGAAHSSVEDARATMLLFQRDKEAFEREQAKRWPVRVQNDSDKKEGSGTAKKKKPKKKRRKR
ncbi:RNA exonuclease 4 [Uncinocarpus reesii 1704]|uniref:RNA exonuclease 4 n=1 Tax=Uncinocarpus reesii (strain UAMH 1704) TaxID=336963 RepID=C4JEB9_UNCRE|nr:RNA exonuclease 4 [Uncinocarpus reesii 1704]EEP75888.1 RNA exonuclease 4 [Uncinocarpus reesii 1704]